MKVWKKNLIAVAMLVTVCAGIYLNWLYTEDQTAANLVDTLDADKLLSSDTLVMSGTDGTALDLENTTTSDYFAAVRLSRQQARDSAVTVLQEAMAYSDADAAQSGTQLEQIVQTALCEAQIESLIVAKGYADCVAYISDEGISVAVAAPEGGLQEKDVAVIADIVMAQSTYSMSDIYVIEV
ncbi:MAG: SpoIIIAH-like family protein [Oscillospiraceae bacterium]|nr:SpoIIIAH-like family protein [Oscillospiraceae bacterium]